MCKESILEVCEVVGSMFLILATYFFLAIVGGN